MSRRASIALLVLLLGAGAAVPVATRLLRPTNDGAGADAEERRDARPVDSSARAPEGVRLRLEVLNGTRRAGLARRATQHLRDLGYDVVNYGTNPDTIAVTQVHAASAHRAAGERVLRGLLVGTLVERAEPLPHLDLRVIVGSDWQPTAESFRP